MLDQLETGIVELRSRNNELASLVAHPSSARKSAGPKKKKKAGKSKAASSKAKPKTAKPVANAATDAAEPEKPLLGKRRALGRSIIQLRRMTAVANQQPD